MSGRASKRDAVVTASARSFPVLTYSIDEVPPAKHSCACPPSKSVRAGASPRYGTWVMLVPVIIINSSPDRCCVVPLPADAMLILPGLALAWGFGRYRWIYLHDEGRTVDARNRHDVADEIVIELVVEGRVDCSHRAEDEERIAIGRGTHGRLDG